LALLGGAIWAAAARIEPGALSGAKPWHMVVLAAAVVYNLFTTSVLIWSVTQSFDLATPVRVRTMFAMICTSHLLNYLPLSVGVFGRAAYMKQRYGMPLRQSAMLLGIVLAIGATVTTGVVAVAMVQPASWRIFAGVVLF